MRVGRLGAAARIQRPYWLAGAKFTGDNSIYKGGTLFGINRRASVWISPDGINLYVHEYTSVGGSSGVAPNHVLQYILDTPWDISRTSVTSAATASNLAYNYGRGLHFSPDGTKYYVRAARRVNVPRYANIQQVNLVVPWDITTGIAGPVLDILNLPNGIGEFAASDDHPSNFSFSPDGSTLQIVEPVYVAGTPTDSLWFFDLSTPWDIGTAVYNAAKSGRPQNLNEEFRASANSFTWSDDGLMSFTGAGFSDSNSDGTYIQNALLAYEYTIPFDIKSGTGVSAENFYSIYANNIIDPGTVNNPTEIVLIVHIKVFNHGKFALAIGRDRPGYYHLLAFRIK